MKPEIYKEFYKFEWDHRSHLTSALNIPIAGATVVGGGIAVMVKGFPYKESLITNIFGGLSGIAAVFLVIVLFYIFKSFHGYKYNRIATPLKFKAYHDKLLIWHNEYGNGKESADIKFEEYFNQRIAEAAEVNSYNNLKRSAYLYRANASLAFSLFFIFLAAVPYLVAKIDTPKEIYQMQIVNPVTTIIKEQKMPENEEVQNQQSEIPPEPTPPRNEEVREYSVDKESNTIELDEKS